MIFDLNAVVSNFSVKVAHSLIGSFFWCFLSLRCLRLKWLSSDESESSLEDGSDKSSFRCLRRFFFFLLFFLLGSDSNDDESDESDDYGSGSRFTFGLCFSLLDELFSDRVILNRVSIFLIFLHSSMFSIRLSSSRVILNRVSIFSIFSRSSIIPPLEYFSIFKLRILNKFSIR